MAGVWRCDVDVAVHSREAPEGAQAARAARGSGHAP